MQLLGFLTAQLKYNERKYKSVKINKNYLNLKDSYLFATVAERLAAYKKENPEKKVISLGIGDVTLPLPSTVTEAIQKATLEMGDKKTFRGYGEYQGCGFLQNAVAGYYKRKNVDLEIN